MGDDLSKKKLSIKEALLEWKGDLEQAVEDRVHLVPYFLGIVLIMGILCASVHASQTFESKSYQAIVSDNLCGGLSKYCYEIQVKAKDMDRSSNINIVFDNVEPDAQKIETKLSVYGICTRPHYETEGEMKCEIVEDEKNKTSMEVCTDDRKQVQNGLEEYGCWKPIGKEWEVARSKEEKEQAFAPETIERAKYKNYLLEYELPFIEKENGWGSIGKWSMFINGEEVVDPWWNASFSKRQQINFSTITNTVANYTATLNVTYDADMQTDFSDVRFANCSNNAELNYWAESETVGYVAGSWRTFYVKLDENITTSNTTCVYMYYKNTTAASFAGNATNTFLFFDDFEDGSYTTKWVNNTGASASEALEQSGLMKITGGVGIGTVYWAMFYTQSVFAGNTEEIYSARYINTGDSSHGYINQTGTLNSEAADIMGVTSTDSYTAAGNDVTYNINTGYSEFDDGTYKRFNIQRNVTNTSFSFNYGTNYTEKYDALTNRKIMSWARNSGSIYVNWSVVTYYVYGVYPVFGAEKTGNEPPIVSSVRITPTPNASTSDTLIGYCTGEDNDTVLLNLSYVWYVNATTNVTGTYVNAPVGVEVNIANITSGNLSDGQQWQLQCAAYDGATNSSAINSTNTTIYGTVINVTQDYPLTGYETGTYSYNLSVATTNISTMVANLTWNGTTYAGTLIANTSTEYNFTANVIFPLVATNNTLMHWNWTYAITFTNGTTTSYTSIGGDSADLWAYYINATSANNSQIIEGEPIATEANISTLGIATINGVYVTFNSATYTMTNTSYIYDYTLSAPEQTPDSTWNTSYYANYSLNVSYNGSTFIRYYSPLVNYTVSNMFVGFNCTAPNSESIAFVFYDQDTLLPINATISITMNITNIVNTSFSRSYSFSNATAAANMTLCFYPPFGDATMATNSLFVATGYSSKTFILLGEPINATLRIFPLYLPNSTTYKFTFIYIFDAFNVRQPYDVVRIYQFYPANGTYVLVSSVQADSVGVTGAYMRPIDTYYQFVVYDSTATTMLKNFTPQFIPCDPAATSCAVNLILDLSYTNTSGVSFTYTPDSYFHSTAFTIGYTANITSGTYAKTGMKVVFYNGTYTTVYDTNSTNTTGGSYSYTATANGTYYVTYNYQISGQTIQYNTNTYILAVSQGAQQAQTSINAGGIFGNTCGHDNLQPCGWAYYFIIVVISMLVGGYVSRFSIEGAGVSTIIVLAIGTWFMPSGVIYTVAGADITTFMATVFATIFTAAVMVLRNYY